MDLLGRHDGLTVVMVVPGLLTLVLVAGMIGLLILGMSKLLSLNVTLMNLCTRVVFLNNVFE